MDLSFATMDWDFLVSACSCVQQAGAFAADANGGDFFVIAGLG